jgi:hypothetical protein
MLRNQRRRGSDSKVTDLSARCHVGDPALSLLWTTLEPMVQPDSVISGANGEEVREALDAETE